MYSKKIKQIKSQYDVNSEGYLQITKVNDIYHLRSLLNKIDCDCDIDGFYLRKEVCGTIASIYIRIKIEDTMYDYPFSTLYPKSPPSKKNVINQSFRSAIAPQMKMWKEMEFQIQNENNEQIFCDITKEKLTPSNTHVHHTPKPFCELVDEFLNIKKITHEEIQSGDDELFKEWEEYHYFNANVKVVSAIENLRDNSPNYPHIPFTESTPRRMSNVKKFMPCLNMKKRKSLAPTKQRKTNKKLKCNKWVDFVKDYAEKKGISYWTALKQPEVKQLYKESHSKRM